MGKKNLVNFKQASNHFMPLTVFDRLVLLQLLPQTGKYLLLKIMGDLGKDLSFSEEEHAQLQFWQFMCPTEDCDGRSSEPGKCPKCGTHLIDTGSVHWDTNIALIKSVQVGPKARECIATQLKALEDANPPQLRPVHVALYEEFVGKE